MLDNGIRTSAPFNALYSIAVVEMERLVERNRNLEEWQKDHRDLTPYAKKLWEQEKNLSGQYLVVRSSSSMSYVLYTGSSRAIQVQMDPPSCTCTTFDQMRIACRHIIAQFQERGDIEHSKLAFHKSYLVSSYRDAFGGKAVSLPVRDIDSGDSPVLPLPYYKQAGRRITRRIASAGEDSNTRKSTYRCKNCSEVGHNKRTCRRHANESDESNDQLIARLVPLPPVATAEAPSQYGDDQSSTSDRLSLDFILS
ncbi:Lipoyl synthase [Phytophthora nicotianae]|uniref:Lipoyl synthase n=1 Tax=Phytophthora nicotianae TaxID=4792 RepID=A0A0W8D9C0_PHYNI|nr:Lipoyl synthase [Phytophthora nicotianae]